MQRHRRNTFAAIIAGVMIVNTALAIACDTPVYRYAMYRWEPAPYEVYHFHGGEVDKGFEAASQQLAAARNEKIAPANVAVYDIDLSQDKDLKTVPRDVRAIWQAKVEDGAEAPLTLVVNSRGKEVYAGELNRENAASLVTSPTRQQIGKLLAKGHAGIFVLVEGKDAALNEAAHVAVDKLITDVNSGKLSLYSGPEAIDPLDVELPGEEEKQRRSPPKKAAAENNGEADKRAHSAASLKFTREALQQQDPWLLRSLMSVEGDLAEFADEPMVFVIYGRGRALPPYIGKGIVYENLVEVTDFITSACSCTVKDQNPGVDLLMSFDWQAASAAVAERFGSEEGNNESLTDLFPQLIIPGGKDE